MQINKALRIAALPQNKLLWFHNIFFKKTPEGDHLFTGVFVYAKIMIIK
jgi:hypothetical protein